MKDKKKREKSVEKKRERQAWLEAIDRNDDRSTIKNPVVGHTIYGTYTY